MGTTPGTANSGSPAALNDRLEQLQQRLRAERRRTSRATTSVIVLGVLLLLLLGGYFAYGYSVIKKQTAQEPLLDFAEATLQDQLPAARQAVADEIKKSAPEWARMLSQQALQNLPTARKKLEEYSLEQCDTMLKEASLLSADQFRAFVRDNRPALEAGFKELSTNPKLADRTLADIEKALEKELQASMTAEAGQLLETLRSTNAKLRRLRDGPKLAADEHLERRIVMLARRLELQQLSPELADKRVPAVPPKEPGLEPELASDKTPAVQEQAKSKSATRARPPGKNGPPETSRDKDAPDAKGTKAKAKTSGAKEAAKKQP
ncbi:MAG TPA: hypothetical protein VGY58_11270 [Gemmataceae bacterium]|nr:hypothetical protein [Gemmataceae bacterium]